MTTPPLELTVKTSRVRRAVGALTLTAATALAVVVVGPETAAQAAECTTPRADSPSGATLTVTSGTVEPGGTITVTGTGFERTDTDGLGQTLAFKLNDQLQWSQTLKADDEGAVAGTLSLADLPAADVASVVDAACGKAWVRVLVGSSAPGDMAPNRSVHASFVIAAPAPAPVAVAAPPATPGASTAGATPGAAAPAGATTAGATTAGATAATSSATAGGAVTTGGQLPQTGIEDAPAIAWIVGLLAVAAGALAAERGLRRRAARDLP